MLRMRVALLGCLVATPAWGWWGDGHAILTRGAVQALPEEMPRFFRAGAAVVANCVYDPDVFKNRDVPHLKSAEHPEHYYDHELLEGRALPPTRHEFLELCAEVGREADRVGLLPYAVVEWTERLALALAEHRRWPANRHIQSKCLVYAGHLAHYAQDLCQPLHLTIHFDGRAREDGSSPHSGIHEKVDALVERQGWSPTDLARPMEVDAADELWPLVRAELERSRALVDRIYGLEEELADPGSAAARSFGDERARASVRFTAALFLTAWKLSEQIELPGWLKRD